MNVDTTMAKTLTNAEVQELQRQHAATLAENVRLKAGGGSTQNGCKVALKGGVSYYGVGRYPVTLYKSQWAILLANVDVIKQFIADNDSILASKAERE